VVTLGIYCPISLLRSILGLTVFFMRNDLKSLPRLQKNVEWKATPMSLRIIVGRSGLSSTGFGLASVCFAYS